MRALITGASGFAGGWLARACAAAGDEVIGISRSGVISEGTGRGISVDITDIAALGRLLREVQPDVIYHLAALSHVGRSWQDPTRTLRTNTLGSASLLDAIATEIPDTRVVWVSSGEVYGSRTSLPISEDAALDPENPYAVSKAAGEMLAVAYAETRGLRIVRARAFAHAGPEQLPIFLISNLAKQSAVARVDGAKRVEIRTGNETTRREVTDVRDVVRAYRLLADPDVPLGVYNVCSGVSATTAERVAAIAGVLRSIEVEHVVDPELVRPQEVPDLRGSHEKLRAATGWQPEIPFEQTLADTIAWWERELSPVPPLRLRGGNRFGPAPSRWPRR